MKATILIVEDEPLIADDIAGILEKHQYKVSDIVDEAKDALESLEEHSVDLALLDINIEGDIDGIELAKKITIPFIFLTSYYDQKTLNRVKETQPAGYIVKPFNENELIANIDLALARKKQKLIPSGEPEKLFVRKDQEIVSVMSDEILYVEAFDNYAYLFTQSDKYIISHTLKSIEEKLLPLGFLRIHRSYLINFEKIDSISEGYVFIHGHKVLIGKSYKKEFFERLEML